MAIPVNEEASNGLAVAVGRIEEGIKNLNEKVDKVISQNEVHADTLSKHDVRLAVLESKQGPRISAWTIALGIIAIAGFGLALFDRLYGN